MTFLPHYNPLSRIMFQSWGATSQFHFVFSVHFSDMPPQNSSILFLHIKIVCSIWLWVKIAHPSNWMIDTKSDGHLPSPILKFCSTAICSDRISSLLDSISSFPMFSYQPPKVHPVTLSARPRLHHAGTGKGVGEPHRLREWAAKSGVADSRVGWRKKNQVNYHSLYHAYLDVKNQVTMVSAYIEGILHVETGTIRVNSKLDCLLQYENDMTLNFDTLAWEQLASCRFSNWSVVWKFSPLSY